MKFILTVAVCLFCVCSAYANNYWVSYWVEETKSGIYLMQIDDTGNVLKSPKLIVSKKALGKPFDTVTAMSFSSSNNILLTALTENNTAFVFTVDPNTMSVLS